MLQIGAFWSYSRSAGDVSDEFIKVLNDHLKESLGPRGDIRIQLDRNPDTGNRSGDYYPKSLIHSLLGSVLFFWVQSPRWLHRAICRFEYAVFEDHIHAIAKEFSADVDLLRARLIVPIRWSSIDQGDWAQLNPEIADAFRPKVDLVQLDPELNLAEIYRASGVPRAPTWSLLKGPSDRIKQGLLEAIPSLDGDITRLLEFAASPKRELADYWLAEFHRIHQEDGATLPVSKASATWLQAQRHAAASVPERSSRTVAQSLALELTLVPDGAAHPFWLSAAPIRPDHVARLGLPLRSSRDFTSGHHRWDYEAASAIAARLRGHALTLPTPGQAAAIAALECLTHEEQRRGGLHSLARKFWVGDDGGLVTTLDGDPLVRPILLTKRVPGA